MRRRGDPEIQEWTAVLEPLVRAHGLPHAVTALRQRTDSEIRRRWRARPLAADKLGDLYQALAATAPSARKRRGVFFTPPALCRLAAIHALTPTLDEFGSANPTALSECILNLRILDPACGAGGMLTAAAEVLADRLVSHCGWPRTRALAEVGKRCLFGVDLDAGAVELARWTIHESTGGDPGKHIRCADALFDMTPAEFGSFDAVLGNPPYANAIEGAVPDDYKRRLAAAYPSVVGAADLAYYFWALADALAKPIGATALVLPRAALNAPAAVALRESFLQTRPPTLLFAPPSPLHFPGANVHVALVVQQSGARECLGGRADPERTVLRSLQVHDANWWAPLVDEVSRRTTAVRTTVGDRFEVAASMTTGQAYELRTFLAEGDSDAAVRFVTTGLIDPHVCRWGETVCRYLGTRYLRPTVQTDELPDDLRKRVEKSRRPKVLIAGLSTRIEAVLDADGTMCGAVSTYSIFDPANDVQRLAELARRLNAPDASRRLQSELGATALGGGRITVTKAFLKRLPWK